MTTKRNITREGLRSMGVPTQLVDEVLNFEALGLDRPAPTEVLVARTLARCQETLAAIGPRTAEAQGIPLRPAVESLAPQTAWTQFLGAFQASVLEQGLAFAERHPTEAAIVLIDNHEVIDPEKWDEDPGLTMLRGLYRSAEETLQVAHAQPLCRVVVLKDNLDAYDDRDYVVMRRAIANPITRMTFIVPSRVAGAFRGRSCAVVGDDAVFEISQGGKTGGMIVSDPVIIRDAVRVSDVRRAVVDWGRSAFSLYQGDQLNPKLKWALESDDNDRLRSVLKGVMQMPFA